MSKAVVSVPGYLCVWEGALFCQMHLGLTGCFTLFGVFKMDTTPESYLDLFPLDAIVYLTPDSENGKYFTCFRQGTTRAKGWLLEISF